MTPIEQLDELAADLDIVGGTITARLRSIIAELRAQLEPCGPDGKPAQSISSHFRAWSAVVDALNDVRGARRNWGADDSLCPRDAAVAAIRSMAAQCSAQPAPDHARPMGVPAIPRAQLDALLYAIGYMKARDTAWPTDALLPLYNWLRTNAPQE